MERERKIEEIDLDGVSNEFGEYMKTKHKGK